MDLSWDGSANIIDEKVEFDRFTLGAFLISGVTNVSVVFQPNQLSADIHEAWL